MEEARSMQLAQQLLRQHGRQLTYNIIHASVFQLPSNMLPGVAEFLASLVIAVTEVPPPYSVTYCSNNQVYRQTRFAADNGQCMICSAPESLTTLRSCFYSGVLVCVQCL